MANGLQQKGDLLNTSRRKYTKNRMQSLGSRLDPKVSSDTQSQKTGTAQTYDAKKEEKVKSSQLLRTGHGDWQQTAQEFLKSQGEYLGNTGPRGDGVDGDWGPTSQAALKNYKKRIDPWALPLVTKNAYGEEKCGKWGCSKLASAKASGFVKLIKGDNEATVWAENAWFDKSHQLNTGGQLIYNEPKRGDMGYVPKELYGMLQVGDFVHLNRAGSTYDKEYKAGLKNEKIEHMGMIIGKDKNGIPLVYHGSEKGSAFIQPINKVLTLPDQGSYGYKYWVSSVVRPKELKGADFSALEESKYHRPPIDVDKKNQLIPLSGASEYQKESMAIINANYEKLGRLGYNQDEINMAGEVLLGGILNMESKALDTEYINFNTPIGEVDIPHPYKNRYAYGAFVKGKEMLASAYKHPVFEGVFTDESRIDVFGKSIPAPGIGEASKSPYQFKPNMHFGTNMRPTPLGSRLYHELGILPEDAADNQKNQSLSAMAILLDNMSSLKRRDKYDSETNTYDGVPLPYVLVKSWQAGAGFVNREKYQDLIDNLDITYSNVALREGREDITSGKGSTIDEAIFDTIQEKEMARVNEMIKITSEYLMSQMTTINKEYWDSKYPAESTNVSLPVIEELAISNRNFAPGGPTTSKDVHDAADRAGIPWDNDPGFMKRSKEVVNKEHIDKMTPLEKRKLINSFEHGGPHGNIQETVKLSPKSHEKFLKDNPGAIRESESQIQYNRRGKPKTDIRGNIKQTAIYNVPRPSKADSEFYRLYSHAKGYGRHKKPIPTMDQYVKNDYMESTLHLNKKDNPDDWTYVKDFDPQNLGTNIMNPPKDWNASKYPVKTNVEGRLYPDVSKDYPVVPTSTEDGRVHPSNIKRFAVDPFLRGIDQGVHMQTGTPREGGVVGEFEGEKHLDLPKSLFGRKRMLKKDLKTYFYSDPSYTKKEARKAAGKMIRKEVMPVYRQVKKDGGSSKNLANPSPMEFYEHGGPHFPKDRKYDTEKKYKKSNVLPGMKKGGRVCKLSDLI